MATYTQIRYPTSDAHQSGTWTASTYALVDDAAPLGAGGDSDYTTHGTTAGYMDFGFTPFSISEVCGITNVTIYCRARKTGTGSNISRARLIVGSTAYAADGASGRPATWTLVNGVTNNFSAVWTQNPATQAGWTVAQVNGTDGTNPLAHWGYTSATDANPTARIYQMYAEVTYTTALKTNTLTAKARILATAPNKTVSAKASIYDMYNRSSLVIAPVHDNYYEEEGADWDYGVDFFINTADGHSLPLTGSSPGTHVITSGDVIYAAAWATSWGDYQTATTTSSGLVGNRLANVPWDIFWSVGGTELILSVTNIRSYTVTTTEKSVSAKALIESGAITYGKTNEAKARINKSTDRTAGSKARIKSDSVGKVVGTKSRVKQPSVTKTIAGGANIVRHVVSTLQSKARLLLGSISKTVGFKTRIKKTTTGGLDTRARIKRGSINKTIAAKSRIQVTSPKVISTVSRIKTLGTAKQCSYRARIKKTVNAPVVTYKGYAGYSSNVKTSSTSITIPDGSTHCLIGLHFWYGSSSPYVAPDSLSLGGADAVRVDGHTSYDNNVEEVAVYEVRGFGSGTQTLAWSWPAGTTFEGCRYNLVFTNFVGRVVSTYKHYTGGIDDKLTLESNPLPSSLDSLFVGFGTGDRSHLFPGDGGISQSMLSTELANGTYNVADYVCGIKRGTGATDVFRTTGRATSQIAVSLNPGYFAKSRILKVNSNTISSKSRIYVSQTHIGSALARLKSEGNTRLIYAKANLFGTTEHSVQSKAQLAKEGWKILWAKASIYNTVTKTISYKARVLHGNSEDINAKSRLLYIGSNDLYGRARIKVDGFTRTTSFRARIKRTVKRGELLVDSYYTWPDSYGQLSSYHGTQGFQTFMATSGLLHSAEGFVGKYGLPTGSIYAKLYDVSGTWGVDQVPIGNALATSSPVDASTLKPFYDNTWSPASTWTKFRFDGTLPLENGKQYAMVVEFTGGDISRWVSIAADGSSPTHPGNPGFGNPGTYVVDNGFDSLFRVYAVEPGGGGGLDIRSRVKHASVTESIRSKARVLVTSQKVLAAAARILVVDTVTLGARSRIKQSAVTRVIAAKSRIKATGTSVVTSSSRLLVVGGHVAYAGARIQFINSHEISTGANIVSSVSTQSSIIEAKASMVNWIEWSEVRVVTITGAYQVTIPISAKASIQSTTSSLVSAGASITVVHEEQIGASARIKTSSSGIISAVARIIISGISTIASRARIKVGLEKSVDALANLFNTTESTVQAKAQMAKEGWKILWARAAIYNTVVRYVQVKARVVRVEQADVSSKARVLITNERTISALARLLGSVGSSIGAKARLKITEVSTTSARARVIGTGVGTVSAKARIIATHENYIGAKARVEASSSHIISAAARLIATVYASVYSRARISQPGVNIVSARARLSITSGWRIAARTRIESSTSWVVSAKARLLTGVYSVVSARARVKSASERSVRALANLFNTTNRTVQAKAQVMHEGDKFIFARASIFNYVTKSVTALSRIQHTSVYYIGSRARLLLVGIKTIGAGARVRQLLNKDITARSRVLSSLSSEIGARARITRGEVDRTISARARVNRVITSVISAKARINVTTQYTIASSASIKNSVSRGISVLANITSSNSNRLEARARIRSEVTNSITARACVTATTSRSVLAKASVGGSVQRLLSAKARILGAASAEIQAKALIEGERAKYVYARASIFNTVERQAFSRARISEEQGHVIGAKARVYKQHGKKKRGQSGDLSTGQDNTGDVTTQRNDFSGELTTDKQSSGDVSSQRNLSGDLRTRGQL